MDEQAHRSSNLLPDSARFVENEFQLGAPFELRRADVSRFGDVIGIGVSLTSSAGEVDFNTLTTENYLVEWGSYDLHDGFSLSTRLHRSYVHLHFQLGGAIYLDRPIGPIRSPFRAGDTNLSCVRPSTASFELDKPTRGSSFGICLSADYFAGLAERYPALLGSCYEQILQKKHFCLRDGHLRITPEMWGGIRRIQRRAPGHQAGSLFLEAQVLELLALQLEQLEQPVHKEDGLALSSDDRERLHAARDVLLGNLTDPPTLAELARQVGTNEYKLKRGFKALFGNSPYAFVLDHKLELARTYLLDTDWTIAEIAYHVGYSDPASLTHAFKKRYGAPPSVIRSNPPCS